MNIARKSMTIIHHVTIPIINTIMSAAYKTPVLAIHINILAQQARNFRALKQ